MCMNKNVKAIKFKSHVKPKVGVGMKKKKNRFSFVLLVLSISPFNNDYYFHYKFLTRLHGNNLKYNFHNIVVTYGWFIEVLKKLCLLVRHIYSLRHKSTVCCKTATWLKRFCARISVDGC